MADEQEQEKDDIPNYQFMSLVYSISQAAMMQLGKISNPMTGKTEKNIVQAKASIDMLDMLKDKTRGNLTKTEEKMLLTTLSNLYLNYSDEVSKEPSAEPKEQEKKEENK
ncbi:hypothetical protein AUJ66_00100 [Candidatus Desantisbacteria bacterium CG1_02_38_46]|uniref:DUF1844 domain-containing protein n=3 Tax=unclassified Candidatus Desantisiibacteriota TaxID=3106372 RepID=A0A2H9PB10_9BACT|nr:MAG: hypothetical protein AUJ66_00100 [Candidatus Desantisbacteria bacterium CG1_02_38_46]PIU51911.1 MAG: DUF1844 domain-containing protein [Candidatus Desantisbacteria bacterium CG07_land_8_20_14_0_80_39_15]PIZ15792.1 MAG: DUF1844 domain-containing protein [Candidatus Desantisbacteria bacterium CG_4_10_14_0_8_um_filter_39_17]